MSRISLAELLSRQAGHARTADERSEMRWEIEQARLAQVQRHHEERLAAEQQRSVMQAQSAERSETAKGEIALAQMARKHLLETAAKSSALIDEAWQGLVREQEEQNRVFWDSLRQLLLVEAEGIRHRRQRKQESECGASDAVLQNALLDQRTLFDRILDLAIKAQERELGLCEQALDSEQVAEWVREAMGQSGEMD